MVAICFYPMVEDNYRENKMNGGLFSSYMGKATSTLASAYVLMIVSTNLLEQLIKNSGIEKLVS